MGGNTELALAVAVSLHRATAGSRSHRELRPGLCSAGLGSQRAWAMRRAGSLRPAAGPFFSLENFESTTNQQLTVGKAAQKG